MLRFILKTVTRDQGDVRTETSTVDVSSCPELERELMHGGYGGGPNGDDFSYTQVLGVEVRAESKKEPEK
jgi:hypothetical protein